MHMLEVHFDFMGDFNCFTVAVVARSVPVGEAVTREAGDDVEVGVENDLAGNGLVVHFDVDAVGTGCFFYGDGKFLYYHHCVCKGFIRSVIKIH